MQFCFLIRAKFFSIFWAKIRSKNMYTYTNLSCDPSSYRFARRALPEGQPFCKALPCKPALAFAASQLSGSSLLLRSNTLPASRFARYWPKANKACCRHPILGKAQYCSCVCVPRRGNAGRSGACPLPAGRPPRCQRNLRPVRA